jgi:gamma-glutamyltranspeptidase/glutathione hydrolase
MNYRRMMRIPSLRKVTAPLAGVVLVLAGCAAVQNAPPTAAGPCSIIANGSPAPKTSAAPASGSAATSPGPSAPPTSPGPSAPPTSRNISTNPEVATGYRTDMTAVRTRHYAVVTANPLATQAACDVLNKGGTAA